MWRGTGLRPSRIKGLRPLRHITAQFTFKAEYAVDLESGALVGITVQQAPMLGNPRLTLVAQYNS